MPLIKSVVWDEPLNPGLQNLASKTRHHSIVWHTTYFDTLNCSADHQCNRQKDRQMDGHTDIIYVMFVQYC